MIDPHSPTIPDLSAESSSCNIDDRSEAERHDQGHDASLLRVRFPLPPELSLMTSAHGVAKGRRDAIAAHPDPATSRLGCAGGSGGAVHEGRGAVGLHDRARRAHPHRAHVR